MTPAPTATSNKKSGGGARGRANSGASATSEEEIEQKSRVSAALSARAKQKADKDLFTWRGLKLRIKKADDFTIFSIAFGIFGALGLVGFLLWVYAGVVAVFDNDMSSETYTDTSA